MAIGDTARNAFLSLTDILQNIEKVIPAFKLLLAGIVYIIGIWFAIKSLLLLKQGAEKGRIEVKAPLVYMLAAVVLLYLPTFIKAGVATIFGSENLTPPYAKPGNEIAANLILVSGGILQFVGLIAFVRGWVLLVRIGEQGAKGGEFSKALMHIIGGLLAINIFGTFAILKSIFAA
jgi:intracellular multiplication protein IcmC